MSVRLCIGEYAKNGYEPENMGVKVYCLEELCYFIKENAWLLDEQFAREELGNWLVRECGLKELGEELNKGLRKKSSLKAYVELILEYACFFSASDNKEILQAIVENSSMSLYEKKKAKADTLVKKGHPALAGKEYGRLLKLLPEENRAARGEVYHCCGVCLAKLFYFALAGEYFWKAYELTGRVASYRQYLWSKRLTMSEKEYMEFLKEHKEAYEDSIGMEEQLEELQSRWEQSDGNDILTRIRQERKAGNVAQYQKQLVNLVDSLKEGYTNL